MVNFNVNDSYLKNSSTEFNNSSPFSISAIVSVVNQFIESIKHLREPEKRDPTQQLTDDCLVEIIKHTGFHPSIALISRKFSDFYRHYVETALFRDCQKSPILGERADSIEVEVMAHWSKERIQEFISKEKIQQEDFYKAISQEKIQILHQRILSSVSETKEGLMIMQKTFAFYGPLSVQRLEQLEMWLDDANLVKLFSCLKGEAKKFLDTIQSKDTVSQAQSLREWMKAHPEELKGIKNLEAHRGLLIKIPKEIALFINMNMINLNYNVLYYLPREIGQLKKLQFLYLKYTRIVKLPSEIEQLTELRFLRVDGTGLRYFPKEILSLPQLEYVDLSDNGGFARPTCLKHHRSSDIRASADILNARDLEALRIERYRERFFTMTKQQGPFDRVPRIDQI